VTSCPVMPLPDVPEPGVVDLERVDEMLQAAALLMGRGENLHAVMVLHREIRQSLEPLAESSPPEQYSSVRQAEEQHRSLVDLLARRRSWPARRSWLRDWRNRLPQWASWVIVIAVGGGLCLRYAWAALDRTKWQRQHPEGNWISRYYSNQKFEGYPLVRYDVGVDYDWGRGAPAKAMVRDRWSVRWDTCFVVQTDLTLDLQLISDDASKLIVDDVPVIQVGPKPGTSKGSVAFQRGVHRLRVEFQEGQGEALIHLQGLDFDGTETYAFQRPVLDGQEVRCGAT
jgi:hypothetical protein